MAWWWRLGRFYVVLMYLITVSEYSASNEYLDTRLIPKFRVTADYVLLSTSV